METAFRINKHMANFEVSILLLQTLLEAGDSFIYFHLMLNFMASIAGLKMQ